MATKQYFELNEIKKSACFDSMKTIIETAFYGNNVYPVETTKEAYKLALKSPGAIVTDMEIFEPEKNGLPEGAKVIVMNDGGVHGRCAAARRIIGEPGVTVDKFSPIIRDAVYEARWKKLYATSAYVGLSPEFMVKAHLCIPEGEETLLLNWLLNFQYCTEAYNAMYASSKPMNDPDIFIFADPQWKHPDFPLGLAFFDPLHNCAAVLGMRYFGELKKGTLTLAWGCANRNGFCSCHGGQKRYNLPDKSYVAAVFGLSGSGKSTITHAKHDGKYDVTVLHDDAFVISTGEVAYSVALEPTYFDKTQDYPADHPDNKYLLTVQNDGVTLDKNGKKVIVPEDIRNGNGRAIKSRFWSPNRIDLINEPVNAIFWLMKDPTLPPVLKLNNSVIASVMGATLATKRTTAERLAEGVDPNALVVEPYANPFRTYPLGNDYKSFKKLFEENKVACYILNTGDMMGKKIPKEVTLSILESIIESKVAFKPFGKIESFEYLPIEGFVPDFNNASYTEQLSKRMLDRVSFIEECSVVKEGFNKLPDEALSAMKEVAVQAAK